METPKRGSEEREVVKSRRERRKKAGVSGYKRKREEW